MACVDIGQDFTKTLSTNLPHDVIEELCLILNPSLPLKDYRSLAGKMGLRYIYVKNLDRAENPTEKLLQHWWSEEGSKTVTDLIELLMQIERHDAIDLLRPHEYTVHMNKRPYSTISGTSSTKEPCEMDSDMSTHLTSDEEERRRSTSIHSLPDDNDDNYDTDEELNRKMGVLGPTETSDNSHFHPKYQFIQRERDGSMDSTSTNGSIQVDVHCHNRKKTASSTSTASNSSSYVEVGIQTEGIMVSTPATSPLEGDIVPNFGPLMASDKIALLIGNENYKKISEQPLMFPKRDVYDFKMALEKLGFKVLSLVDLTLTQMRTIMLAFCKLLGPNVFSLFYFAGHGYEENGENYLMPIDASPARAASEFMSAQEILREMQLTQTSLNLLIIDCCRVKGVNTTGELRPCSLRGVFGNTIVAYSCQSQMPAFEFPEQSNGVYMSELLKKIHRDERIEHILMEVNTAVYGNLYVHQRPVFESDAIGDCRLTAKIDVRANYEHWRNRSQIWLQASHPPEKTVFNEEKTDFRFEYIALYSNTLQIDIHMRHWSDTLLYIEDYHMSNSSQLDMVNRRVCDAVPNNQQWVNICQYRIFDLQRIEGELHIVFDLNIRADDAEEPRPLYLKHNLRFPLISSTLQEFRSWITSEPYNLSNTWV